MHHATLTWRRNAESFFPRGWRRESVSGWTAFVDRMDLTKLRSWSEKSTLQRISWPALQPFSRQFGCESVVEDRVFSMRKSFVWHGRGGIFRRPFPGAGFWAADVGVPRKETRER